MVGAAVGAVVGAVHYRPCEGTGLGACIVDYGQAGEAAGGAIAFAIPGMVIGGVIGHNVTTTTWQRVGYPPVRVTIVPSAGSGVLLSASIAF